MRRNRKDFPLINITKITSYSPLFKKTTKNKNRFFKLDEIAFEYDIEVYELQKMFAMYLAKIIAIRVQEAIKTQKINGKSMNFTYAPLSSSYKKKKVVKNRDKFWINTEFIVKNLRVYRAGRYGDIYIGFPQNVKHPTNNTKVQDIMMYNEAKRPLFKPTLQFVSKRLGGYFNAFLKNLPL